MVDAQQLELNIKENEHNQGMPMNHRDQTPKRVVNLGRWIRISLYTSFILVGQSVAVLLGRLYFTKGGHNKWLQALIQLIGFPFILPLYYILPLKTTYQNQTLSSSHHQNTNNNKPQCLKTVSSYIGLGLLLAVNCIFFTIGMQYLPVSTLTLLSASQLGFNAVFSFLFNAQNFTPYVVNSLVLLTFSSALLVFEKSDNGSNSNEPNVSKGKYMLGFMLTLAASALYGLMLSLSQLVFTKVLTQGRGFRYVLDMGFCQGLVSSSIMTIGLLASGDWKHVKLEMDTFELGKVSYVMTLVWSALLWQIFTLGLLGLTFEVSSLFSIVISTLSLPITPVLAVIFLHDKMDGIKGVSMALAIWGFVSYIYQQYLDEFKNKNKKECVLENEVIVQS